MATPSNFENAVEASEIEKFVATESLENVYDAIKKLAMNKKKNQARENAASMYDQIHTKSMYHAISNFEILLVLCGDNAVGVSNRSKSTAETIITNCMELPSAISYLLVKPLLASLDSNKKNTTKLAALKYLEMLSSKCSAEIRTEMIDIVPILCDLFTDIDSAIYEPTTNCLLRFCSSIQNIDVDPFIPRLIEVFKNNEQSTEVIHSLASVTFVQEVDSATLSVIVPVLLMGFRSNLDATKRLAAVIVANMIKLVVNPVDIEAYMPRLLPVLQFASNTVSEPEARQMCTKSFESLNKLNAQIQALPKLTTLDEIFLAVNDCNEPSRSCISKMINILLKTKNCDKEVWENLFEGRTKTYARFLDGLRLQNQSNSVSKEIDDAELLCNCKFTLAYGSKILLHNTELILKRGYRYGLLGGNGSGKSTLLKAIVNEQIDGFPPSSILKTVFVEADILGELSHLSCLDYIYSDSAIRRANIPREEIQKVMLDIGFTEKMCNDPVTTLSGGWRMKLALSRAMLQKADILLMDEPTNHLDVINVAWVENYLINLKNVTSIIVSHNKGVLDRCCTHIINIENFKRDI